MEYLKSFENHVAYSAAKSELLTPNVSYCEQENEVHYNPIIEPLVVKYNVTDANNPIQLYRYYGKDGTTGAAMFDKVVIDGTEVSIADLDAAEGNYQFSLGEHTAKYTLKDPTLIGVEIDKQTGSPTRFGAMFPFCGNVTSIEIPNSVSTIGRSAFQSCSGLTSVNIPNSVTSIGYNAFNGCSGLTSVTIPNSVTSIGESAFEYCSGLASVTIGNSVTSIGNNAFNGCSGLTSVIIPNSVTSIGDHAFESCSGLTSVTILNSGTSIGEAAFCECLSLDSASREAIREINRSALNCILT